MNSSNLQQNLQATTTATGCGFVKITQAEADKIQAEKVANFQSFSLLSVAGAQSSNQSKNDTLTSMTMSESLSSLNDQLTLPFYLLLISFFIFVIIMTIVYLYHWTKFSLSDPFIKNFMPIFLVGLVVLSFPLIVNLIF